MPLEKKSYGIICINYDQKSYNFLMIRKTNTYILFILYYVTTPR